MLVVLKLSFLSFNKKTLKQIQYILNNLNFGHTKVGPISFPTKKKRFCILRSPFKHKDSREHLEIMFYKDVYFFKLKNKERVFIFVKKLFEFLNVDKLKGTTVRLDYKVLY